jgi:hypothetical protein
LTAIEHLADILTSLYTTTLQRFRRIKLKDGKLHTAECNKYRGADGLQDYTYSMAILSFTFKFHSTTIRKKRNMNSYPSHFLIIFRTVELFSL